MSIYDQLDEFYGKCACQTASQNSLEKNSEVENAFDGLWNEKLSSLPTNWTEEDVFNKKCEIWQYICKCLYDPKGCDLTRDQAMGVVEYVILSVCAAIFVIGIIGNGLTLWVLLKTGKWRKNTTNLLIWSLSIADFSVVLFMVPLQAFIFTTNSWPFSNTMCKSFHFFIYLNLCASNYLMLIMSSERFFAIVFTMRFLRFKSRTAAVRAIVAAWTCAIITSAPVLWIYSLSSDVSENLSICSFGELSQASHVQVYRILLIVLTFILPAGTVSGQAFAISSYLRREPLGYTEKTQRLRVKVMLMTVACCALFILFWTPYHANQMRIVLDYYSKNGGTIKANDFVYEVVAKLFSLGNSIVNPFIYFSVSESFQLELRKLCGGKGGEISADSTNQQSLSNESSGFNRSVHIGFVRSSSWNRSDRLHSARTKMRTERNCASP